VQNLKKLQKFANLINLYMSDKPVPTTTATLTTSPLNPCHLHDIRDNSFRRNGNRRKPISSFLVTDNWQLITMNFGLSTK